MKQAIKNVSVSDEGALKYKKNVVLQVVELATKEISGVASFSDFMTLKIKKAFTLKKRGMIVTYLEDGLIIDVFINILFGYSVNDVAFRIQENVKSSVESMTEFKVKHVNVHINGVLFENNEGKIIT